MQAITKLSTEQPTSDEAQIVNSIVQHIEFRAQSLLQIERSPNLRTKHKIRSQKPRPPQSKLKIS